MQILSENDRFCPIENAQFAEVEKQYAALQMKM